MCIRVGVDVHSGCVSVGVHRGWVWCAQWMCECGSAQRVGVGVHSGCVSVGVHRGWVWCAQWMCECGSAQRVGVGVHSGCVSVGVHRGWVGARSVFALLVSYGAYINVRWCVVVHVH